MLTAIDKAVDTGDLEGVKQAVSSGADLSAMGGYDATPLANAVAKGHLEIVRYLLDAGADPDNGGCSSVITNACGSGSPAVCEVLLEAGSDPDILDSESTSGVEVAVHKGYREILELLVQHRATVQPLDEHLEYAKHRNKEGSHNRLIEYLRELKDSQSEHNC